MAMDRGMVGNHTACTKEVFVVCIDQATARHAALPARCLRAGAAAAHPPAGADVQLGDIPWRP
eukprot:2818568-Pyramimonas_sp.AAC.1